MLVGLCYVLLAVLAACGIANLWEALELHRRYRLIQAVPTSTVGAIQEGLREVKGRILPVAPIKAPLSGRPCVYYQFRVDAQLAGGKWRTVHSGREGVPFLLDDGTGRILICPEGAALEIDEEKLLSSDGFERLPAEAKAEILNRMGLSSADEREARERIRCGELTLATGDMMYALGQVTKIGDLPETMARPEGVKFALRRSGLLAEFVLSNRSERAVLDVIAERRTQVLVYAAMWAAAVLVVLVIRLFVVSVPEEGSTVVPGFEGETPVFGPPKAGGS
ncbi:MAG: hypothetical protein HZA54_06785 [Planctomycetes bacterium]|nr:hypothetical protein [Planctomycetota bacterium]